MDMHSSTTSRLLRCSCVNLLFCRRLQISVFTLISIVYFTFMVNLLFSSFINKQDVSDNVDGTHVLSENISNVGVNAEENSDNSSDNEEYSDSKTLIKPSPHQGLDYCKGSFCINNCCPPGRGFVLIRITTCVFDSVDSTNILKSSIDKIVKVLNKNTKEATITFNEKCESNTTIEFDIREVRLMNNGNIIIEGNTFNLFCLDFVVEKETILAQGCSKRIDGYIDDDGGEEEYENVALSAEAGIYIALTCLVFMVVSKALIVTTLIIYSCIPQLRNIYGKIVICYLVSIVVFHLTFIGLISYEAVYDVKHNIIEFFYHTALFSWMGWLTVLCFDIWDNFSHPLDAHPHIYRDNRKFKLYSIGVWGNVVLHTTIQGIVNLKNSESFIIPLFVRFGVTINVVMFLATLHNFRFHRINIAISRSRSGHVGDSRKEGVLLYMKLSLLMGLDWLVILVCQNIFGFLGVFISFIIIESQGITLFFLLVCNNRVLRFLREH